VALTPAIEFSPSGTWRATFFPVIYTLLTPQKLNMEHGDLSA